MTPNMLTALLAAGVCAAAVGPFLLDLVLTRRGEARLRLAERVQAEQQAGFVNGCGPVRRATVWDVRAAEERIACTAWRFKAVSRRRDCRERREARRALRHLMTTPVRRRPRHCAPPAPAWPFRFPRPKPVPEDMTPCQAIVAELRGAL